MPVSVPFLGLIFLLNEQLSYDSKSRILFRPLLGAYFLMNGDRAVISYKGFRPLLGAYFFIKNVL